MGKINLYAPFAGVKDGLALLALLQDQEKLEEVLGVVKVLDDRIAEINAAIEVYGKASQIDALLLAAKERVRDAVRALHDSGAEAQRIVLVAKAKADQQHDVLKDRELFLASREKEMDEREDSLESEAEKSQAEMAEREQTVTKRAEVAAGELAEGKALKKRYEKLLEAQKAAAAAA